jgi:hypothetical protein
LGHGLRSLGRSVLHDLIYYGLHLAPYNPLHVRNLFDFKPQKRSSIPAQVVQSSHGVLFIDAFHNIHFRTPRVKGFLVETGGLNANFDVISYNNIRVRHGKLCYLHLRRPSLTQEGEVILVVR